MASRVDAGLLAADRPVTFRAWAQDWLEHRAQRNRTGGTVAEYERNLRAYAFPEIGGKRLGSLTVLDIERLLDKAHTKRGLSASSLNNIRKSISAVLTDAVRAGAVAVNVARGAVLPMDASPAKPVHAPSPEQVQALLAAADGTEVGRALLVLVTSGVRVGELLGAKWSEVDLKSGLWSIERTVSRDRQNKAVLGSRTKNKKSRTLCLPAVAVEALKEQRRAVLERRMLAANWSENDLVFPSRVGTVMDPSNFRKQLNKVRVEVNRKADDPEDPCTVRWGDGAFHALRHYFASNAMALTEAAQVQQLLGHTALRTTTSVYGHLTPSVAATVPEAVANTLLQSSS